jgi:hypothetical protein
VLSLFKVRTVLKPLIEKPPTVLHGETGGALERLQEQLRNNSMRGMELQARLAECSAHLQALRQTYNNLTKKGEQSKETRRGIVERGAFVFSATGQAHVLCDGTRIDQARLRELRSHALLEINSKQGESGSPAAASEQLDRERLESFLEMTMLVSLMTLSSCAHCRSRSAHYATAGTTLFRQHGKKTTYSRSSARSSCSSFSRCYVQGSLRHTFCSSCQRRRWASVVGRRKTRRQRA